MDYLSFDLRLGEWNPAAQEGIAEVLQSPAGEGGRYAFRLEIDVDAVEGLTSLSEEVATRLGRRLAVSIFSQQSLTLWYESYQVARERGRGLRLRLHIDSWELSRLPWELLYDSRRGEFLVFDPLVSVVRYIRLYSPPPALRHGTRLKVLAVSAAPKEEVQLDWRREFAVLREAVAGLSAEDQLQVVFVDHLTQDRLHGALYEHTPDVVHYVGHAGYDRRLNCGLLLLEDGERGMAPLAAPDAARMLRRYGVNLVVLNACETAQGAWAGVGPSLVRREVPAVVAMQWPVEDRAAIRFSEHFYRALAQGRTIDECVAQGRMGASATGTDPLAWGAPVLFLRSASGRLWTVGDAAAAATAPPPQQAPATGAKPAPKASARPEGGVARPKGGAARGDTFKTRGPLTAESDAELLIDRPELRRALRLAQQPSVTQYVAVLSARQMGKTTLLLRLVDLLGEAYPCVFIDLSVLRGQKPGECYRFVAARLVEELRRATGDASLADLDPGVTNAVDWLELLSRLAKTINTPRILILLDEVGALSAEASDSFFNAVRTVFTQGRGLRSELAKYLFVFSGAVDLYGLTYGTNSPLNICEKIYLQDLSPADVGRLVGLFRSIGVSVPKEAPERIYALTGGHPYLTMRLCALLEQHRAKRLGPEQIEAAAEELLVEDDNLHHLVRELERLPQARQRLAEIVLDGAQIPFSRVDPVLAALEMIGAIKPSQPCQVRNHLYERSLRPYLEGQARRTAGAEEDDGTGRPAPAAHDVSGDGAALGALREAALGPSGAYQQGRGWQAFAEALFRRVPAFSVYANVTTDAGPLGVLLAVDAEAEGGAYWRAYEPAVLVEPVDLAAATPRRLAAEMLGKLEAH
ncbi:MAG: CHAT domain-containing protein, partial [Chloroflexi bacterium]|nr:CHAT domain-containing protein [Chloroflexota bacterium]